MKKIILSILCFIVCCSLLLTLCACGGEGWETDEAKQKELIVGEWECSADMGDVFETIFANNGNESNSLSNIFDVVDLDGVELTLRTEFKGNGEYKQWVDSQGAEEAFGKMYDAFMDKLPEIAEAAVEGREDLDEYLKKEGLTKEEYIEQVMGNYRVIFGDRDNFAKMSASSTGEGKIKGGQYKIENGKLYMVTDGDFENADAESIYNIKINNNELKMETGHKKKPFTFDCKRK